MEYLHIILMAVVQGLTEFLPVSSKAHLSLTDALLMPRDAREDHALLATIVMLHLGTLVALFVVFWRRIARLLADEGPAASVALLVATVPAAAAWLLIRLIPASLHGQMWMILGVFLVTFLATLFLRRRQSLILKLFLATIPGGVMGLIVKKTCPWLEGQLLLTGFMFLVTATLLLRSRRYLDGTTPYEKVSYRQAMLIGCAQACAVLPGMSRSGTTIVAGLMVGLRRDAAATFSFLLSIPIISAACLLEALEVFGKSNPGVSLGPILVGVAVSFVVGLVSLIWLLRWLERGKLHHFAYYLIPLGMAVIVWQLVARLYG